MPGSNGLRLAVMVRPVQDAASFGGQVPTGTRCVSVFLVNRRTPVGDGAPDPAFAFQAALEITSPVALVPRPNLRGLESDDRDECVASLQYCDAVEYAVGHNVSTHAVVGPDGKCREVHTRWIPTAKVERVAPADISGVDLGVEPLAALADGADARQKLGGLVTLYRQRIDSQRATIPSSGTAATPNVRGQKGDNDQFSARSRTLHYQTGRSPAAPVPLEECPWCGEKFGKESFRLLPGQDHPTNLRTTCSRRECAFVGDNPLPTVAVDEPIYRRLPCFLLATVDKFAAMPWTGQVGAFFGRVERFDREGFSGPCEPGRGAPLPLAPLPPPDLVIQDELHLISGPMGTMVGLYEAAAARVPRPRAEGTAGEAQEVPRQPFHAECRGGRGGVGEGPEQHRGGGVYQMLPLCRTC